MFYLCFVYVFFITYMFCESHQSDMYAPNQLSRTYNVRVTHSRAFNVSSTRVFAKKATHMVRKYLVVSDFLLLALLRVVHARHLKRRAASGEVAQVGGRREQRASVGHTVLGGRDRCVPSDLLRC